MQASVDAQAQGASTTIGINPTAIAHGAVDIPKNESKKEKEFELLWNWFTNPLDYDSESERNSTKAFDMKTI